MQASIRTQDADTGHPVISIISAVYNVSAYLPDFFESLDRQVANSSDFEVILVNDGSTDNSTDLIEDWIRKTQLSVRLLHKQNGGQASARNHGLLHARGEWVTFPDPDDFVDQQYLAELLNNIEIHKDNQPAMYVTRIVRYLEETGEFSNNHALQRRFRDGNRIINLDRSPDFFHMSGPTAVLQRKLLIEDSLQFNEKLRFSFEDAHFVASYLLNRREPTIGYLTTAEYFYRIRAAGTSSIQTGALKPEKYTDVLEFGHLDLLSQCERQDQPLPEWLQYMLLYDILWYLRGDRRVGAPSRQLPAEVLDSFHGRMELILNGIDDETINDFDVMPTDRELRDALLLGYKHKSFRPQRVSIIDHDEARQMTKLEYIYSGEQPLEIINYRGIDMKPIMAKTQGVPFLGRRLFYRRHIWIPSNGTFSMSLDGKKVSLEFGRLRPPAYRMRPVKVARHFVSGASAAPLIRGASSNNAFKRAAGLGEFYIREVAKAVRGSLPRKLTELQRTKNFVHSPRAAGKFSKSWVFLDRINAANDNAEHLYRHIRVAHPKINSWFVLDRESSDWSRLESEGFRLLAYGSKEHYAALTHAEVYASSHLDRFITSPLPKGLGVKPCWKFVFLQHGVTLHDQSAWFNSKDIDLLVTATNTEYALMIEDGGKYKFSTKEIQLTGFPRHDALKRRSGENGRADSKNKLIILSPTWREGLTSKPDANGQRELSPDFISSNYAIGLRNIMGSPVFLDRLESEGFKVAYLPHPNMVMATPLLDIDSRVEILSWQDTPFSEIVQRADIWVTDYSSTAFEAAYAEIPVIYYQCDQEEVSRGLHIYDASGYSFENEGFGPVATDAEEFMRAVKLLSDSEGRATYAARRDNEFPYSDDGNSARVVSAIRRTLRKTPASKILSTTGN